MQDWIGAAWQSFEATVVPAVPADAGPGQRQELRRAFYAGAWAAIQVALQISDDAISEEVGLLIFEGLVQECREFQARVQAGTA